MERSLVGIRFGPFLLGLENIPPRHYNQHNIANQQQQHGMEVRTWRSSSFGLGLYIDTYLCGGGDTMAANAHLHAYFSKDVGSVATRVFYGSLLGRYSLLNLPI